MTKTPILLPGLQPDACFVGRSGFIPLRREGQRCAAGEPIGFCYLVPAPAGRSAGSAVFPTPEIYDLSAVLLAPATGVLRWSPEASAGGWADLLPHGPLRKAWEPCELGAIDGAGEAPPAPRPPADCVVLATGHRVSSWADVRGTLLAGWYDRVRAWPFSGALRSLVVATGCAFRPVFLGAERSCHELLTAASVPLHLTYLSESLLIPTARSLVEELERTAATRTAILEELRSWYQTLSGPDSGRDATAISFLLSRVEGESPLFAPRVVLQEDGLRTLADPPTILVSIENEEAQHYRHKVLPWTLALPTHLLADAGENLRRLLQERFVREPDPRPEQLAAEYRDLARLVRERGSRLIVANSILLERGAPAVRPALAGEVTTYRSHRVRVINELLRALEDEGAFTVLDIDQLVAAIGTATIPDGVHGDRRFAAAVRDAVLEILGRLTTASSDHRAHVLHELLSS